MRTRQTFLLTVLTPENDAGTLRGKLKVISSGKSCTFTSLEELFRLIASEMDEEFIQKLSSGDLLQGSSEEALLSSKK